MTRILTASDLSARSVRAWRRAQLLGGGGDSRVLHVVDDDQPPVLVETAVREAEAALRSQIAPFLERGQPLPEIEVVVGDPFRVIAERAQKEGADVIVMGAHRRDTLRSVFVGTTVERVMRSGRCPVLMVEAEPAAPYRHVVVGFDGAAPSLAALETVRRLGFVDRARVSLAHAFTAPAKAAMIYANASADDINRHVTIEAAETRRRLTGVLAGAGVEAGRFDLFLEEGAPVPAIRSLVVREGADLLVLGTRGLGSGARMVLGSVAEGVLSDPPCDVLVVPPSGS